MARKRFNWMLAIVLLIALGVLVITAVGLRKWRRNRMVYTARDAGLKAYETQNWQEAAEKLGRYLNVEQTNVQVILKYAHAKLNIRPLQRGNIQQAVASYRSILRIDKSNLAAAKNLVSLYLQMNIPAEAQLIAERYLQTNENPKIRRMLAVSMARQRDLEQAADQLRTIVTEHPEEVLAYEMLGKLIERYPQDFSAVPEYWFDEAIKNNPSSALAHLIRAAFHLRTKQKPKALTDLQQAEELDLSGNLVRLRLAKELIDADILDRAEIHLSFLQNNMPTAQALWQTWAQLALKSRSKTKMLKIAESGLEQLASQPWDFMPTAAELYIECNELDLAADCISKLRRKSIAPSITAFLEGLVADKRGRGYQAVKCYRQAIQLGDESTRVRLALAAALSRLGDKQAAIRQLRTLVSDKPDSIRARLNLIRLLVETASWIDAAEQARAAMQISLGSPDPALLYIQAQIKVLTQRKTDKDSPLWTDIENHLAELQKAPNKTLQVKVLHVQLAAQRSQFSEAQRLLDEIKQSYPAYVEITLAEVEILTAQQRTEQAILKLYEAVKISPESVKLLKSLTALLAAKGRMQECENIIEEALTRIHEPTATRELGLLLAGIYSQANKDESAYQLLNTLVHNLPNDLLLKRELLKCAKVIKNPDRAQQLVDEIKTIEGEQGWQWRYEQARVWFASDSFKNYYPQIISLLKESLLANPDDQAPRVLLAATYERLGKLKLAISTYNEALNYSPQDLRIIVPAVAALYKANEYDRADEILHRAASEKIFHPELKKLQLQSHLKRGRLSSACDILENLLADDPNDPSICFSLALLKMRQNKFSEAVQLLSQLKTQQPNALPVIVAQIELNARQGKSDKALLLCEQIMSEFNNAFSYILRARTYTMLGQHDKAEKDFEHATTLEPNNVQAWTARSDFYRSKGHLDKAVTNIKKAGSLEPDNLGISKRTLSLLLAAVNPDALREAENILDNALTLYTEDTELHLYKARLLLAEGNAAATEKALDILQKITEDQPILSEAWALLAEVALRRQQSLKAIDIVLRGLVYHPNDKSLLLLKARAEAARSPALAIPTLKALQDSDPNDIDIALLLADTYLAASQSEEAVNLLKKLLISCSSAAEERKIRLTLAAALHKNGNKADAQKEFDSLVQSAPDDPGPLLTQARLLKDDELWEQLNHKVCDWYRSHIDDTHTPIAIAGHLVTSGNSQAEKTAEVILRMILEHDSGCTEAMSALALLLQLTGRSPESAELYRQILTIHPDNVIAINNLAWIMCQEYGNCREAIDLAQRGLRTSPEYIDLIDTRGVAYYKLGQYDKAIQDFTRCLEMYPHGTSSAVASYLHLGRALAKVGQKQQAIETLRRALKMNAEFGGLSSTDVTEVRRLLEKLSQGV